MAVNLVVQAEVVDITRDSPVSGEDFLVDTNVWYWMTYSKASLGARSYQINSYPAYASSALSNGARLLQCGLSLAELTHLIEKAEREIYTVSKGALGTKEYRHNFPSERLKVCAEVDAACKQVLSLADPLDFLVNAENCNNALSRFSSNKVDGYDLFILESMDKSGVAQVITDDGDFSTVAGIRVFTANRNVIAAAKAQGRLITR